VALRDTDSFTDTHCHLDFNAYDNDRDDMLERARQAGINRILNPGIDLPTSQAAVKLAGTYPEVYAAVGVHPNESLTFNGDVYDSLLELASNASQKKIAALGEIGLDYYRDRAPRDLQREVFGKQLDLAAEMGLPVVIHNRNAMQDTLAILSDWQASLEERRLPLSERPGVLHSFDGDLPSALKAIELNFLIGITGPVTFKNARSLQQLIVDLPIDRLLVETDGPFLTPHPHRGKRNEPAYIPLIVDKIAVLKEQPLTEVAAAVYANARKLFNW
jgi:TatD DNase family protein